MKNDINYLTSCLRLYRETGNELFFNMFVSTIKTNTPIVLGNTYTVEKEELSL